MDIETPLIAAWLLARSQAGCAIEVAVRPGGRFAAVPLLRLRGDAVELFGRYVLRIPANNS